LIELLGDDAEAEDGDEQSLDDSTAADTTSGEPADDEAHMQVGDQVSASWSNEAQRGMIELDRRQVVTVNEVRDPEVEPEDAQISLQDLTLELDAVIGSARTFELGDAERETNDDVIDTTQRVESQSEKESQDEPLATRAAVLPLLATIVRRRDRKSNREDRERRTLTLGEWPRQSYGPS
jgi:hypothetical protein